MYFGAETSQFRKCLHFFLFLNAQDDRTSPLKRLDPSCSHIMSRCSYVDTKTRENEIRVNNLISSSDHTYGFRNTIAEVVFCSTDVGYVSIYTYIYSASLGFQYTQAIVKTQLICL